jgi:hypothetical protein
MHSDKTRNIVEDRCNNMPAQRKHPSVRKRVSMFQAGGFQLGITNGSAKESALAVHNCTWRSIISHHPASALGKSSTTRHHFDHTKMSTNNHGARWNRWCLLYKYFTIIYRKLEERSGHRGYAKLCHARNKWMLLAMF